MKYSSIEMYKRNKNVFMEGAEGGFVDKAWKYLRGYIAALCCKKIRPVLSERIVEYPIIFQYLDLNIKNILDFGCVEDFMPIHLSSLGFSVTGLDFRYYPFTHPNFKFIRADILSWEPPIEAFDTVISVSTIEHVGLSAYADPIHNEGDKIAVKKLCDSLKKGGDLLVTLPAGKKTIERGMRIYDADSIKELIPNIEVIRFFYKINRYSDWEETTPEKISDLRYENYNTVSPAQGVAFVKAKKPLL